MWEITPKKAAVAQVELVISDKANRGTIHDEVSTILRSSKVKDLTVQMMLQGSVVIPQIEVAAAAAVKDSVHTEDDLNCQH